jgi:hypothetical protein
MPPKTSDASSGYPWSNSAGPAGPAGPAALEAEGQSSVPLPDQKSAEDAFPIGVRNANLHFA